MTRLANTFIGLALVIAACTSGQASPSSPSSSTGPASEAQLKFALLERFGELWYCDPDEFPISRGDEAARAAEHFPEIAADTALLQAIVDWIEFEQAETYTPEQQLEIYRAWKLLNAIELTDAGNGRYRFDILTKSANAPEGGVRTVGVIDASGAIEVERQEPSGEPACPICLARGTRIATPAGEIRVEALRVGDLVWSRDAGGRRVAVRIERSGSAQAPARHRVVRLILDDGRAVTVSPGHPLADGRSAGELRPGDLVDGARVMSAELIVYRSGRTYDILPAGATGVYWADGILMGSTLHG
jgi:Hint domain-containing protein